MAHLNGGQANGLNPLIATPLRCAPYFRQGKEQALSLPKLGVHLISRAVGRFEERGEEWALA